MNADQAVSRRTMWPSDASNALYAQCNDCMQAYVCHTRPYATHYAQNECLDLLTFNFFGASSKLKRWGTD